MQPLVPGVAHPGVPRSGWSLVSVCRRCVPAELSPQHRLQGQALGLALAFEMPLLREKCTVKLDQKMCCTSYVSILWCIVFNTDTKMLTKLYLSSFALLLTHFMHTFTDFFQWKVVSLLVQYQHRRVLFQQALWLSDITSIFYYP